jgi:tetratricopeptide (TPR) repeat protein
VEERAHRAEVERAAAEVRAKEQRKRRRVQLALAASVLALVGVAGGGAWWADRQAAERRRERAAAVDRARLEVSAALAQAGDALAAEKPADADAALAQVEHRLPEADAPDLRLLFTQLTADRQTLRRLDEIFELRFTVSEEVGRTDPDAAKRGYDDLFRGYGLSIGDERAEATVSKINRSRIAAPLLAGLIDWFFLDPDRPGMRAVLDAADPDPTRTALRAAMAARKAPRVRELAAAIDGVTLPPAFAVALGARRGLSDDEGYRLMKAAWDAKPDSFPLALQIGNRLMRSKGRSAECVGWFHTAIALRPANPVGYSNLAHYYGQVVGDGEAAVAVHRRAVRAAPHSASALTNLGVSLMLRNKDYDGAITVIRNAIDLSPNSAPAHCFLGRALGSKGDVDGAMACYRKAVELQPKVGLDMEADSLLRQKNYAAAEAAARVAIARNPRSRSVALLAHALHHRGNGAEGYRVIADAIRADPAGADDPTTNWRYNGACLACVMAAGPAPPVERGTLRKQALDWLTADLAVARKRLEADPARNRGTVQYDMRYCLTDPELASARHPLALALLPAGERAAWVKLWQDADALRRQAAGK